MENNLLNKYNEHIVWVTDDPRGLKIESHETLDAIRVNVNNAASEFKITRVTPA